MIRNVRLEDANALSKIYNYYILNTIVTFEEQSVCEGEMKDRIMANNPELPWLVCEDNTQIIGYAYASKWKERTGYKKTIETTIYLDPDYTLKGFGFKLYTELINRLKKNDYHALIGGISLPNNGSITLHEKLGFKKVAHFKETGFKFNEWVDVGYWELIVNSNN